MAGASGRPRSGVLCCVARYLQRCHVVAEGESRWLSCKNVPIVGAACTLGAAPPLHRMKPSHLTPIMSPFLRWKLRFAAGLMANTPSAPWTALLLWSSVSS